jgi:hypothetical protein
VASVVAIATAKNATLQKIHITGVHLRAFLAARLIAGIPAVILTMTDDCVSIDAPGADFYIDPNAALREMRIARNAYYVLHWWRVMPRCLVALELSDTQCSGVVQLFDALRDSLATLRAGIALQSLSIARVVVPADQLMTFKELLEVLLISEHIKLKSLDISGTAQQLRVDSRVLCVSRTLL